ncbi:MAG: efflux RND transporter periplasmic adaptor subunit [Deltaproteobacteria bacterium]|nr:efflux RND transporter periplasmic adaptor subunit [Deltaproteobacteria bacterium]
MNIRTAAAFLAIPIFLSACHRHDDPHGHGPGASLAAPSGEHQHIVRLAPGELERQGIEIREAGPLVIQNELMLAGEIRLNEDRLARIRPRYAGIVKSVNRRPGDQVQAGDILATVESSEGLTVYPLKAMISGSVIERHVSPGDTVDTTAEAFIVADLTTVWADFSVFQNALSDVRTGQKVTVAPWGTGDPVAAEIVFVTPVMVRSSRTATARTVLPNSGMRWKPGMFVTGRVVTGLHNSAIGVPVTALQTVAGETGLFVTDGVSDGLEFRLVRLGARSSDAVEVISGLFVGERYAATGTFILKAELLKSEAEHDH